VALIPEGAIPTSALSGETRAHSGDPPDRVVSTSGLIRLTDIGHSRADWRGASRLRKIGTASPWERQWPPIHAP